jgi:hypothetical protein
MTARLWLVVATFDTQRAEFLVAAENSKEAEQRVRDFGVDAAMRLTCFSMGYVHAL